MHRLRKNILILGGGFAGVESAITLAQEQYLNVTLVSDRKYFYVAPTSIWIPTGENRFSDNLVSLHKLAERRNFNLIIDEVVEIVGTEKEITLKSGKVLNFDYLIVALGADKLKPQGVEKVLSICGDPVDALDIHKKLELLIAEGSGKIAMGFGANPKDSSAVRGGPVFELFFNVHHRLKKLGIRDNFEMTFFAPMETPGARMGETSVEQMNKIFEISNLKQHYGKKIKEFKTNSVVFEDNSNLEADLIVFVPGNSGKNIASDLPLSDAGFIEINQYCQVKGFDNIYAVGDVAKLEGAEWRAKQGHIAEVMARGAARDIIIKENRLPFARENYQDHINILCVMDTGNGAAFVYRDDKKQFLIPLPFIGHLIKKAWGIYIKLSKLGYIPRIPGM